MGEIRVTTGHAFHGSELVVRPPEADVLIMGSTMAVIRSFFFGVRFIYFPSWTPLKRCKDARMAVTNEFTASKVSSGDLRNRKSR